MDMVVHQTEADYLYLMVQSQAAEAEGNPVDTGNEFFRRSEKDIVFEAFGGAVIEMKCFHVYKFFVKVGKKNELYLSHNISVPKRDKNGADRGFKTGVGANFRGFRFRDYPVRVGVFLIGRNLFPKVKDGL